MRKAYGELTEEQKAKRIASSVRSRRRRKLAQANRDAMCVEAINTYHNPAEHERLRKRIDMRPEYYAGMLIGMLSQLKTSGSILLGLLQHYIEIDPWDKEDYMYVRSIIAAYSHKCRSFHTNDCTSNLFGTDSVVPSGEQRETRMLFAQAYVRLKSHPLWATIPLEIDTHKHNQGEYT